MSTTPTSISTASLSEVSNISGIELPLRPEILWNPEHYIEGSNTAFAAVSADNSPGFFAALDQQKSDGSLRASPMRAQQLNPIPAVFVNTFLNRAFYGNFGSIGPVFVKAYIKMMPERQLVLSGRLPLKVLVNEFKRGNHERVKSMCRAWTGLGEWFLETSVDKKFLQAAIDLVIGDFIDLLDRGEIQEANYYFLALAEGLLRVMEMDNKLAARIAVDALVQGCENAVTHPLVAQFAAMVEYVLQKINLSTTALSGVQRRLSLSTHPQAWLTMVLVWEGDSWLLEVSIATAAVLLQWPAQQTDSARCSR
ncbi:uncharacterized protein C8A04DRAFT_39275 [Dichotomopilus funicola]|uniref:Uncharacterized protein n=1 Tax=Dichotomopilus funicola TaxID=1934379 RepID=A0AAN6ZKJ7_9PEZI|nr:hypothetical protein C8A04DRAFT_39275 [Dichotomopilus funicola]